MQGVELLHADYQAALLRVVNVEAWEEPAEVVEIDDGLPSYEPAFEKLWPSRDLFGDVYFERRPDAIPQGVTYHGEVEITAVREPPVSVAAAAAAAEHPAPAGFEGLGAGAAGALRLEHAADRRTLNRWIEEMDSMKSVLDWASAVDVARTTLIYVTILLACAVLSCLLIPSVLCCAVLVKQCATIDLPRLARRAASWLLLPAGLAWLLSGLQGIYTLILSDACHEMDVALATPAAEPMRAPAFDGLLRCGTQNAFADTEPLKFLRRRSADQVVAVVKPGCLALTALCLDKAAATVGCNLTSIGGEEVSSPRVEIAVSSSCTIESLAQAAASLRLVERTMWSCPPANATTSAAQATRSSCAPAFETHWTLSECVTACGDPDLRSASSTVQAAIESAVAHHTAAQLAVTQAVLPLSGCHFWRQPLQAMYTPLCVDAFSLNGILTMNLGLIGLFFSLAIPFAAAATKRFDRRLAVPTAQTRSEPPIKSQPAVLSRQLLTLFGLSRDATREPVEELHDLANRTALCHPYRLTNIQTADVLPETTGPFWLGEDALILSEGARPCCIRRPCPRLWRRYRCLRGGVWYETTPRMHIRRSARCCFFVVFLAS
jgi:hypothetical protein